jgi:hypothetical protein
LLKIKNPRKGDRKGGKKVPKSPLLILRNFGCFLKIMILERIKDVKTQVRI